MWHHFLNLLARSWAAMARATGTTTLGFLVWTLSIAAVGWAATVTGRWLELKREKADKPFRKAVGSSLWPGVFLGAGVCGLVLMALAVFGVRTIYGDHQALVGRIRELDDYAKNKADFDRRLSWAEGEVKHWQDAYQRAARGETKPDRIMNHEEEGALYDDLARLTKDPRNKEYIKIKLTSVSDRESRQLANQLWQVFQKAHWNVPIDPKFSNADVTALNSASVEGVTIFTDDPTNHGVFLQFSLRDANIDSQVYRLPAPNLKGTVIVIGLK
jgi:hypothetical protein